MATAFQQDAFQIDAFQIISEAVLVTPGGDVFFFRGHESGPLNVSERRDAGSIAAFRSPGGGPVNGSGRTSRSRGGPFRGDHEGGPQTR